MLTLERGTLKAITKLAKPQNKVLSKKWGKMLVHDGSSFLPMHAGEAEEEALLSAVYELLEKHVDEICNIGDFREHDQSVSWDSITLKDWLVSQNVDDEGMEEM